MTKQINTGVAELLLYRVPRGREDYYSFTLTETGTIYGISNITHEQMQVSCDINLTNFELLGIAHELTEEVWIKLLPSEYSDDHYYRVYEDYADSSKYAHTATESGLSLLMANECYAVNPYDEPDSDHSRIETHKYVDDLKQWNQAQQSTGKWIALKPITNGK